MSTTMFVWVFFAGRAGLTYAGMRSVYEYMIDLKVRERRRRALGRGM
jgi:hypothetical protein